MAYTYQKHLCPTLVFDIINWYADLQHHLYRWNLILKKIGATHVDKDLLPEIAKKRTTNRPCCVSSLWMGLNKSREPRLACSSIVQSPKHLRWVKEIGHQLVLQKNYIMYFLKTGWAFCQSFWSFWSHTHECFAQKKYLGQHFFNRPKTLRKILPIRFLEMVISMCLKLAPAMGVLTQYLLEKPFTTHVVEIDTESVDYLKSHFSQLEDRILEGDFFKKWHLSIIFDAQVSCYWKLFPIIFSSQILFIVIEQRTRVPEFAGMFQKEVCSAYLWKNRVVKGLWYFVGINASLLRDRNTYLMCRGLFFDPPPKVASAVIRLKRKAGLCIALWR